MKKIVFAGEAMLELTRAGSEQYNRAFAGDVFNSSVYLKRAFPEHQISFMSGIGEDALSEQFMDVLKTEHIDTQFIGRTPQFNMGIYMVNTDDKGERSFLYWRNSSAAKEVMTLLSEAQTNALKEADIVFFSGISLAILPAQQRERFFELLDTLKQQGCTLIFDPNYRARLWQNANEAKQAMLRAFELSDWLMPGVEDFTELFGLHTVDEVVEFCSNFSFTELVIKQGSESVVVVSDSEQRVLPVQPSKNVVDTTSAGDAFNGIYLGSRMSGMSCEQACELASYLAARVVETPGAIMKPELFKSHWNKRPTGR